MGAGQSSSSQASVCDFSEEQILKIDEENENIYRSIIELKKSQEYNPQYTTFVMQQSGVGTKGETTPPLPLPLVEKSIFLDNLRRILKEYKTILEWIINLCKKYKSVYVEKRDVERDIDEFISVNMIKAQTLLNTFNQNRIGIENSDDFKEPINIINKINVRFSDVEKLKNEMKAILKQQEDAQTTKMFSRTGGSSSSRFKKRKQMKMKMKSSNYRSKTRNSKKKYNGKSVKK